MEIQNFICIYAEGEVRYNELGLYDVENPEDLFKAYADIASRYGLHGDYHVLWIQDEFYGVQVWVAQILEKVARVISKSRRGEENNDE